MTTHACPPEDAGLTPCCRCTPFQLPGGDRMTLDPELVTCMADRSDPPMARYRYTLVIEANTHDEIERELRLLTGKYAMDSHYGQRDEFHTIGGTADRKLEHRNPDMTPERYDAELDQWWQDRKANR